MAKRSYNVDKGERVEVKEEKIEEEEKPQKSSGTVKLVLLRDLKLNYTGPVTGKKYVFAKGGAVVDVDEEDAAIMLAKRGGSCCPGGSGPQPYFAKEG
jgi:hypothetical protein